MMRSLYYMQYFNFYSQLSNILILTMPKQVIVIMEDNYPFGECEERTT